MNKIDILNKIDEIFKNDEKFMSLFNQENKSKKKPLIILIVLTIVFFVLSIVGFFGSIVFFKNSLLETVLRMISSVFFITSIVLFVVWLVKNINKNSVKNINKKYLAVQQFRGDKTSLLYEFYIKNTYKKVKITDFRIFFNEKIHIKQNQVTGKYEFISIYASNEENYADFMINGLPAKFYTDLNSNSSPTEEYSKNILKSYGSRFELMIFNYKYANELKGLRLIKANSFDPFYQTESELFNKKFDININPNDLRAPLFLTPKFIDRVTNANTKDMLEIGVNDYLYFLGDSYSRKYDDRFLPIGILNYINIKNYSDFKEKLYTKLLYDIERLSYSINFLIDAL
ncbi:hypothetical protein [Spiroplasma turonicum]|uniref:Transmembrane protein n=1 Tax=Spiroplasma turonicum TaxID=216946 RepID=A0A0K1P6V2_9MOLU|nr:hypothetical protein [Spiroplasma turonicum]AKU80000.1 hypothetical protein STURON_00754 [Spiroplasma turonicum]ALX71002.1 hypothetical protein STURO_v1c07510 [Spiroplasma turonicum]